MSSTTLRCPTVFYTSVGRSLVASTGVLLGPNVDLDQYEIYLQRYLIEIHGALYTITHRHTIQSRQWLESVWVLYKCTNVKKKGLNINYFIERTKWWSTTKFHSGFVFVCDAFHILRISRGSPGRRKIRELGPDWGGGASFVILLSVSALERAPSCDPFWPLLFGGYVIKWSGSDEESDKKDDAEESVQRS